MHRTQQWEWDIRPDLKEDEVWTNSIEGMFEGLPDNVVGIWHYGFTEMLNNAIDHSEGSSVFVEMEKTPTNIEMMIRDNGRGIFKKIQSEIGLLDERHAILELSKGKLTTDPENHTGEGIFFSSRMFDDFRILSGGVFFSHEAVDDKDWILESNDSSKGTLVQMRLSNTTSRTDKEIFDEYAYDKGNYGFVKTVVPVRMAKYGEKELISRSQAKRLLVRVEKFKTVLFDFTQVETIGHSFADEIFRVFAQKHPNIELIPINESPEIRMMVHRAKSTDVEDIKELFDTE